MAICEICGQEYSGFWAFFSPTRSSEESFVNEMESFYEELSDLGIDSRSVDKYPSSLCTDCLIKKNTETKEFVESAVRSFVGVQRGDYIRGATFEEVGWIKVKESDSPSSYEAKAKRLAILAGANALIKSNWVKESQSYLKGYSKNGNAYYGTRYSFRGEALAVKAVLKASGSQVERSGRPTATSKYAVFDASNLAREKPPDIRRIGCIARDLRKSKSAFVFIFDANFSHIFNLSRDQSRMLKEIGLEPNEGSVVPSGSRADDFIIQLGGREGAVIVSNDRFSDRADDVAKMAPGKIVKFLVMGNTVLIPELKLDVLVE